MTSSRNQDEMRRILQAQANKEQNNQCADCCAMKPHWASTNLGLYLCIRCAGIHRSLGTHISFVRSITIDNWTEKQFDTMLRVGNERGRQYYEATKDTAKYPKPSQFDDDQLVKEYIQDKYVKKRWIYPNFPPPHDPAAPEKYPPLNLSNIQSSQQISDKKPKNGDFEDEEEIEEEKKQYTKQKSSNHLGVSDDKHRRTKSMDASPTPKKTNIFDFEDNHTETNEQEEEKKKQVLSLLVDATGANTFDKSSNSSPLSAPTPVKKMSFSSSSQENSSKAQRIFEADELSPGSPSIVVSQKNNLSINQKAKSATTPTSTKANASTALLDDIFGGVPSGPVPQTTNMPLKSAPIISVPAPGMMMGQNPAMMYQKQPMMNGFGSPMMMNQMNPMMMNPNMMMNGYNAAMGPMSPMRMQPPQQMQQIPQQQGGKVTLEDKKNQILNSFQF